MNREDDRETGHLCREAAADGSSGYFRALLAIPAAYSAFQRALGAGTGRAILTRDYYRPTPGERVLDIGCGPADILEHLPGVEYVGFDASPIYIADAQKRFGGRGSFFCQEVNETTLGQFAGFDLVIACGVLHHLDDAAALRLLEIARAALKPTGRLVTTDGCYVDGQSRIARFLLSRDRGEFVRIREHYAKLAHQVFPHVECHLRHDLLRLPYTHLIMECRLASNGAKAA